MSEEPFIWGNGEPAPAPSGGGYAQPFYERKSRRRKRPLGFMCPPPPAPPPRKRPKGGKK